MAAQGLVLGALDRVVAAVQSQHVLATGGDAPLLVRRWQDLASTGAGVGGAVARGRGFVIEQIGLIDAIAGSASAAWWHVDPLVAAACVSFGFVLIHPFMDGNGRLSRFLFHHQLCPGSCQMA